MQIKATPQGLMIYLAMGFYLAGLLFSILRKIKEADVFFLLGFFAAAAGLVYRAVHVDHLPMQNLFEVFLSMGTLIYPVSLFCRKVLDVDQRRADMLIGAVVLFPAGFIFPQAAQYLPPALQSWLFGPHVAAYMLSYVFLFKAGFQGMTAVIFFDQDRDRALDLELGAYRLTCAGFPLLTLGLVLGSIWAKLAWGHYWGWDPKELWSLASMLVYVGYFHFRFMFGRRYLKINSLWLIAGMGVIIITLLWVNLSRLFPGLHNYAF